MNEPGIDNKSVLKRIHTILSILAFIVTSLSLLSACRNDEQDQIVVPPVSNATTVVAATDKAAKSVNQLPVVIDRFEVGQGVYARAIAVEPARDALWVGTSAGVLEVNLSNQSISNTFTRKDGLANEYVFAIGIDSQGHKWFGTNAGGMSRYKEGTWKTWFPMHGLADYWVYSFGWQSDGTQWIGTWAGVNRLDAKTGEMTTYIKELVNEWVYGISVDSLDRVWFGTEGGISRFDGKEWQSWTHDDGLGAENKDKKPFSKNTGLGTRSRHDLGMLSAGQATYNPNYVFSVHIDPDDTLWAGTWGGGISKFDGNSWTNYTESDGLAGDIVYAIAQDESGVMWFGTNKGLSRFDGKNWTTYGRHEGIQNLDIYALVVAPDGDIWAGTNGSVIRLGMKETKEQ